MRWWIELIVSTLAYWICAAVVVVILAFFLGHCGHGSDAERAACVREARTVVWVFIAVALTAYLAIVGWWITRRRPTSKG